MGFELPLGTFVPSTFVPRVQVLIGMRNSNITDFAMLPCYGLTEVNAIKSSKTDVLN